jgi:hypothetical protein
MEEDMHDLMIVIWLGHWNIWYCICLMTNYEKVWTTVINFVKTNARSMDKGARSIPVNAEENVRVFNLVTNMLRKNAVDNWSLKRLYFLEKG